MTTQTHAYTLTRTHRRNDRFTCRYYPGRGTEDTAAAMLAHHLAAYGEATEGAAAALVAAADSGRYHAAARTPRAAWTCRRLRETEQDTAYGPATVQAAPACRGQNAYTCVTWNAPTLPGLAYAELEMIGGEPGRCWLRYTNTPGQLDAAPAPAELLEELTRLHAAAHPIPPRALNLYRLPEVDTPAQPPVLATQPARYRGRPSTQPGLF